MNSAAVLNTNTVSNTESRQGLRRGRNVAAAVAVAAGSLFLLGATPASAADCAYPEVCVQPVTIEPTTDVSPQSPSPTPQVQPAVQQPPVQQPAQLPVTGSDVGVIAAGGLLLVGAGVFMTRRAASTTAAE